MLEILSKLKHSFKTLTEPNEREEYFYGQIQIKIAIVIIVITIIVSVWLKIVA
jgi:hypothetical protein